MPLLPSLITSSQTSLISPAQAASPSLTPATTFSELVSSTVIEDNVYSSQLPWNIKTLTKGSTITVTGYLPPTTTDNKHYTLTLTLKDTSYAQTKQVTTSSSSPTIFSFSFPSSVFTPSSSAYAFPGPHTLTLKDNDTSEQADISYNLTYYFPLYHATPQVNPLGNYIYVSDARVNLLPPSSPDCGPNAHWDTTTNQCVCEAGLTLSPQGICYNASSTHVGTGPCTNPTGYLQDWDGCDSLQPWSATDTSGETVCLADSRDGKTYMVRKLPDNRCWMVNNLAYGASDKYNGTDVCVNRETMTSAETNEASIKDKFGGQSNSTTSYGLWGDCRGTKNVADASRDGYYYNWAAAMQQTNTWYGSSNAPTYQANVQGLCPDGWVLPTGGTDANSDFHKLATAVNGSHAISYNDATTKTFFQNSSYGWHGLYSGYTNGTGGLYTQGSSAYYWSSTLSIARYAYNLNFGSSSVNPEINSSKSYGFSVRCLRN